MTLSRTARILIALLLVAAAAFLWINLFASTPDSAPILTRSTPGGPVEAGVPPAVTDEAQAQEGAEEDAPVLPFLREGAEEATPSEEGATTDDAPAGQAGEDAPVEGPPTVVAPSETDVVGRDVVVAEFPFLITAPPIPDEGADAEAAAGAAGAVRPGTVTRATVNPFSPIVVQAPAIAQQDEADPPPASPDVIEVDVPAGPPTSGASAATAASGASPAPSTPDAPAPRALAPSSPRVAALPRPLPSGTLPVAPDLLRDTRAEAAPRTPVNVPDVVVREPTEPEEAGPALRAVGGTIAAAETEPAPLAPGEVPAAAVSERPIVAGSDPLSRYLRDRNVTFTGSVVGSVGVGVFRLENRSSPIVLALGQPLPDSDIVLTDLRGQAAEFTLGDTSQILNLDLRR